MGSWGAQAHVRCRGGIQDWNSARDARVHGATRTVLMTCAHALCQPQRVHPCTCKPARAFAARCALSTRLCPPIAAGNASIARDGFELVVVTAHGQEHRLLLPNEYDEYRNWRAVAEVCVRWCILSMLCMRLVCSSKQVRARRTCFLMYLGISRLHAASVQLALRPTPWRTLDC